MIERWRNNSLAFSVFLSQQNGSWGGLCASPPWRSYLHLKVPRMSSELWRPRYSLTGLTWELQAVSSCADWSCPCPLFCDQSHRVFAMGKVFTCWSGGSAKVFSWLSVDSATQPSLHLAWPSTDLTSSIFRVNGRLSMKIFVKNSGGSVSGGLSCPHYLPHRKKGAVTSCI